METAIRINQATRDQLKDIMLDVSWAKVSQRYFGKSPSWIYHKMDAINGNGSDGGFSETEKEQFKSALFDLSERIRNCANII